MIHPRSLVCEFFWSNFSKSKQFVEKSTLTRPGASIRLIKEQRDETKQKQKHSTTKCPIIIMNIMHIPRSTSKLYFEKFTIYATNEKQKPRQHHEQSEHLLKL